MYALTTSPPPDNSVVAGPIGFAVFILLILAVAFLCWSFTQQLKKAQKAKEAGVYGDEVVDKDAEQGAAARDTRDSHDTHDAER
jgi:type III secretory pathway component EscV